MHGLALFNNATLLSLITSALPYYYYRTASSNSSKYVKRTVHTDIHSSDFEDNAFRMEANWTRETKRYSYKNSPLQPRFGYRSENTGRC